MDIICVMLLLYSNGRIAQSRGQSPRKYRLITLALCFGLEIIGSLAGMLIATLIEPENPTLRWAYVLGFIGIVLGALLSRVIVKNLPNANFDPSQATFHTSTYNTRAQYVPGQVQAVEEGEQLTSPATVRIVNEYYWNETKNDLFFLNGIPVCTLQPGNEYTFLIHSVKNVFSIGRPNHPFEDTEHTIRFVAAEKGYIEIIVKDGKIVIDRFKNLKGK